MELEEILGKYSLETDPTAPINLDGTLIFDINDDGDLRATIQNDGHKPKVVDGVEFDDGECDGVFRYHGMKIKFHAKIEEDGSVTGDADAGLMDIEFTGQRLEDE